MSDVTLEVAADRVAEIQHDLQTRREGASISAGLAELDADDTISSLLARADNNLYRRAIPELKPRLTRHATPARRQWAVIG